MVKPLIIFYLIILFLLIPAVGHTQQNLLLYSEINSSVYSEKESDTTPETDIFLKIDNNLISDNMDLSLGSGISHSINDNQISSWDLNLQTGYKFTGFSSFLSVLYTKNLRDSLTRFKSGIDLFYSQDDLNKYTELAFIAAWNQIEEIEEFSNIDIIANYLLKKYHRNLAFHHDFALNARIFNELIQAVTLLSIHYQFKLSFSLQKNIGVNFGVSVDHNLIHYDDLIYKDYLLYDEFAFNMNRIFSEMTIFYSGIMFKPHIALVQKKYLETAVEESFMEYSLMSGFYGDVFLSGQFLLYSDGYFQIIDDESEISSGYGISTGIKYQFDLFSSQRDDYNE